MNHETLQEWLVYIDSLHFRGIDLGLGRVRAVYERMTPLSCPVITVGGTNGKGSTAAILESLYRAAGYRTGAYFSPHLMRYNERVRINAEEATDEALCQAFAAVEEARGTTSLTYFEFGTLAAIWLFTRTGVDIAILEVGLGGRLDAVNIIDADVAVVVSVGTDHKDWLGPDRETIGREKAGIFRGGRPAVVGFDVSDSVWHEARRMGARALIAGRDFRYEARPGAWRFVSGAGTRDLPYPALRGGYQLANASCALAAAEALPGLTLTAQDLRTGLQAVRLAGRFQTLPGPGPRVVLDVAHNAEAARTLAQTLREQRVTGRTLGVVGMLKDKPVGEVFAALRGSFDDWFLASLDDPRGADAALLEGALRGIGLRPRGLYGDPVDAFATAIGCAGPDDRIVVFGSFKTVGAILAHVQGPGGGGGGRVV
ncbi:bifunctional tetrahydrofolate synthase/dihydrofolate synthase [Acidiferrobacter sp.]|uniref:bifunctional tetrahydrofolate synthase/dihydrofolate synthase n=1 Tax=Acidiferrobacter sp. TaxID=1872107 RepID=UPI00345BEE27